MASLKRIRRDRQSTRSKTLFSECFDESIWLEISHGPFRVAIPLPQEMVATFLASDACRQFAEHGPDTEPWRE